MVAERKYCRRKKNKKRALNGILKGSSPLESVLVIRAVKHYLGQGRQEVK
jgi:hypothetical protein